MRMDEQFGTCTCCGRTDVPLCPKCGKQCPHGYVPGTWLPCGCDGEWIMQMRKLLYPEKENE